MQWEIARRRRKIFVFQGSLSLWKCYFLKEKQYLEGPDSQNFLHCPPMMGGKFSQLPPHGGGEVFSTAPPALSPWGRKLPPQPLPHGGAVFSGEPTAPPPWGGSWTPALIIVIHYSIKLPRLRSHGLWSVFPNSRSTSFYS